MARLHASGALGQKDYAESHKWQILSARHNGLMWQATDYGAGQFLSSAEKQAAMRAAAALEKTFQQSGLWDAVSVSVSVSSGCDFLQNAAKCGECIVTNKNLALHKNQ